MSAAASRSQERTSRVGRAAALAAALLILSAPAAWGARDDTLLVSRASGPAGAPGDGNSIASSLSPDGRFVAFASEADNLSAEDNDAVIDVYVRDVLSEATSLASRVSGPSGAGGDGDAGAPSVSADGRFVAFDSDATNLSGEDGDPRWGCLRARPRVEYDHPRQPRERRRRGGGRGRLLGPGDLR